MMKKISFNELDEWAATQDPFIAKYAAYYEDHLFEKGEEAGQNWVEFHEGDLHVDTLLISPFLVVNGNLTVTEKITYDWDCGLLVVTGDLRVPTFSYPFSTAIKGNLLVDKVEVNSGCDYYLWVDGDLHADAVIERGHVIEVNGDIHAPVVKSMMNYISAKGQVYEQVPYEDEDEDA